MRQHLRAPVFVLLALARAGMGCGESYGTEESKAADAATDAATDAAADGPAGGDAGTTETPDSAAGVDSGPDYPPGTCLNDQDGGCICQGAGKVCTIRCAKGPCSIICSGGATCAVTCNDDCSVMCTDSSKCNVKDGNCSASGESSCSSS